MKNGLDHSLNIPAMKLLKTTLYMPYRRQAMRQLNELLPEFEPIQLLPKFESIEVLHDVHER